jgi:hypothetical protein
VLLLPHGFEKNSERRTAKNVLFFMAGRKEKKFSHFFIRYILQFEKRITIVQYSKNLVTIDITICRLVNFKIIRVSIHSKTS